MTGTCSTSLNHTDLQLTRFLKDEADVQSLFEMLVNSWVNPFREEQEDLSCAHSAIPFNSVHLLKREERTKVSFDLM